MARASTHSLPESCSRNVTIGLWLVRCTPLFNDSHTHYTVVLTMYLYTLYALPVLWLIWNAYIIDSVTILGVITAPAAFKASQVDCRNAQIQFTVGVFMAFGQPHTRGIGQKIDSHHVTQVVC